jgi:uncharacterized protein YggE
MLPLIALSLVSVLSFSAHAAPAVVDAAAPTRSLRVVGTARVDLVPDEACVELTFAARDPAMTKAHATLSTHVTAFERSLDPKSGLRLEQGATRYQAEYGSYESGRRLSGYYASQQLNVRTKDFDRIPEVVGLAAAHGLEAVQVVYYDTSMVERKVALREAAIRAAREKAEAMAAAFGVRLGAVRTVLEGGGSSGGGFGANVNAYAASPEVDDVSAPKAPGSIPLTLSVEVEYDLQ